MEKLSDWRCQLLKSPLKANYKGHIFIEGNISKPEIEMTLAFKYLTLQLEEVYAELD